MASFQIGENLPRQIGHVDGRVSKLAGRVDRFDDELDDLRKAVKSLNAIVSSMRVQISDLRRSEIPDEVWNGEMAPGEAGRR